MQTYAVPQPTYRRPVVSIEAKKQSWLAGFAHAVRGNDWVGHEQPDCQSYTNGWNAGEAWLIDQGEVA